MMSSTKLIDLTTTQRKFLTWLINTDKKLNLNNRFHTRLMIAVVLNRGSYFENDRQCFNDVRDMYLCEFRMRNKDHTKTDNSNN